MQAASYAIDGLAEEMLLNADSLILDRCTLLLLHATASPAITRTAVGSQRMCCDRSRVTTRDPSTTEVRLEVIPLHLVALITHSRT